LTKKYPKIEGDLSTMIEETIYLSLIEYTWLESKVAGNVLEKNRYSKEFEGYIIEIDEYLGELAPLVVMDIEYEIAKPIITPFEELIVKEITQNSSLAAGKIAGKKYEDIIKNV
jgi:CYTH domain-containing protein